ncbi:uncharacterized protein [Mytilus edulis]|uniref:uncharacterized protein n=1 Tax=Mytilus edulis TaxID=6550 RepID=UPI0039EF0850
MTPACIQSINPKIDIIFLLFVLHFILLVGNIEPNPGPDENNISSTPSSVRSSEIDKSISICNLNIRSIRNKLEFLNNFTDEFDVLAVTETHLDPSVSEDQLKLDSFNNIIRKDRNNFGGGLMIYVKDDIGIVRKSELENPFDETLWVEIRAKGQNFLLCHSYRPPNADTDFWARLNHAIETAFQFNENIVITGDLNSDLFNVNNNKLIDTMDLFNLRNVIDKATRVTDKSSTLLDPIIISDCMSYYLSDVLDIPSNISDHNAAVIFLECPSSMSRTFKREVWIYDKMDKEKFLKKMNETDWYALLPDDKDVNELCEIFTVTFLNIARECIPTKQVTIRKNDKPWFNSELRREIRIRDRLRKKAFKSKKQSDILKYKRQRNRVNNMKKVAKEKFESNLDHIILNNVSNTKTYWKIMKMLIKSNNGSNNIPPLQNIINTEKIDEIAYKDEEKCELLNKYFNLISKLNEENINLPQFETKSNNKICDIHVTIQEIIDMINILDPNKASGPDVISHRMLKICPDKVAIPLQIIFNKSLSQSGVPQGSVLGPLLFIIYINDIAEQLTSLCRLFADDTSFSYSGHDEELIQSVVSRDLRQLDEWSRKWLMSFNPEKTEIMMFSNNEIQNLNFTMNNKEIPIVRSHKHLGVTFRSDAKWNNHVENILNSVKKHLNILRKLKYQLSRQNLEKLYLVFIRPIFEYATEVWDNCGKGYSIKLEQLQLEAARIVTGLPVYTHSETVLKEVGWETLEERRKRRKLQLFYKIQNNNAPEYLCNLVPPKIQSTTQYPLRNGQDIILPFCRLTLTSQSFIPSTIKLWNNLNIAVRNVDSLPKFKVELKNYDIRNENQSNLKHYLYGPRKLNIILTQFRCSASFLNCDLFRANIISDPTCKCGLDIEDMHHFFFDCPFYLNERAILFNGLSWLPEGCDLDLTLLVFGRDTLSYDQNVQIVKQVFNFIKRSKRFLVV